jgi:hypothetical protein
MQNKNAEDSSPSFGMTKNRGVISTTPMSIGGGEILKMQNAKRKIKNAKVRSKTHNVPKLGSGSRFDIGTKRVIYETH